MCQRNNMEYRKTHLINEYGDRQVVETRNVDEEIRRLNEKTNSTYYLDVDWYLANGYSIAEDAFRRIERGYASISQEEINHREWLTIDEAKEETIIAIKKEYEGR